MEEYSPNLPLTKQELKKLLFGLEKQAGIHSMLNLILSSGMSIEDALSIKLSDIDYSANRINLWKGRRIIKLPERVMKLLSDYQNGYKAPEMYLYEITIPTACKRLNELSVARLGKPYNWRAIRRSWALLCFERHISLKSMVNTSGISKEQLSVWSLYKKEDVGFDSSLDLLSDLYS